MTGRMASVLGRVRKYRAGIAWSLGTVVVGGGLLYLGVPLVLHALGGVLIEVLCGLAVVLFLVLVGHSIHCFTRDLPAAGGRLPKELRAIFVYGYFFMALALLAVLLPFAIGGSETPPEQRWAGVVSGCVEADDAFGSGLTRCGDSPPRAQWLVHVGGTVATETEERLLAELTAGAKAACEGGKNWDAVFTLLRALGLTDTSSVEAELRALCTSGPTEADIASILDQQGIGVASPTSLSGGLVVPLYVVLFAVAGGVVGMTRRLPEIQRRAAHSTQGKADREPISAIEAREMVVFQVMQVVAAPIIAMATFAALEPETVPGAMLVGFASGFASEAVLKKLRQASEAFVGEDRQTPRGQPTNGVDHTPDAGRPEAESDDARQQRPA